MHSWLKKVTDKMEIELSIGTGSFYLWSQKTIGILGATNKARPCKFLALQDPGNKGKKSSMSPTKLQESMSSAHAHGEKQTKNPIYSEKLKI